MPRGCEYFLFEMESHEQSGYQTGSSARQFHRQGKRASGDHIGMNNSYPAALFMTGIIIEKYFTGRRNETVVSRSAACLNHAHNAYQRRPKPQSRWHFRCHLDFFSSSAWLRFSLCRCHFPACYIQASLSTNLWLWEKAPEGRISQSEWKTTLPAITSQWSRFKLH